MSLASIMRADVDGSYFCFENNGLLMRVDSGRWQSFTHTDLPDGKKGSINILSGHPAILIFNTSPSLRIGRK